MSGGQNKSESSTSVEQMLDELQRESEQRRAKLREIAAQLPATMSRRAILRSVAVDIRRSSDKRDIARRAVRKLSRAPARVVRTIKRAVTSSGR